MLRTLTTTLLALALTTSLANAQEPAASRRSDPTQAPGAAAGQTPDTPTLQATPTQSNSAQGNSAQGSSAQGSSAQSSSAQNAPTQGLPGSRPNRPLGGMLDPCPTLKDLPHFSKSVADVTLNISVRPEMVPPECRSQMPSDCATELFARRVTNARSLRADWSHKQFHWAAAEVFHQPLYFEDIPLERYGQSYRPLLQPWLSGARFFATFPIIPYKMGIDRPFDHIYTLGYYRPDSFNPCVRQRLPWEWDAAAFESAAWLALIVLLP